MKLRIFQIVLEESTFGHRSDYLSLPASTPIPQTPVAMTVSLQAAVEGAVDGSAFVFKLKVMNAGDSDLYHYAITFALAVALDSDLGEERPDEFDRRLIITGANILFPFIREHLASLTSKGRFGTIWLSPTDFSTLELPNATAPATTE